MMERPAHRGSDAWGNRLDGVAYQIDCAVIRFSCNFRSDYWILVGGLI